MQRFIVTSGFGRSRENEVFEATSLEAAQARAEIKTRAKGYDLGDVADEIGAQPYSDEAAYDLGLIEPDPEPRR